MKTYRLRNVMIYDASSKYVVDKPHFHLTPYVYNQKRRELVEVDYKVSIGFLLDHSPHDSLDLILAKEKVAYDKLQGKVYEAFKSYDPSLSNLAPTILFNILTIYGRLVEIEHEQDYILGSEDSLKVAKPLAEIYKLLKEEKSGNRRSEKEAKFSIGGCEFTFANTDFVEWLLALAEKAIVNGDYNFNLGYNMLELEEALLSKQNDALAVLSNQEEGDALIEQSRFLTSFCLKLHKYVCVLSDADVNKFNAKQTKFYRRILQLFEVPGWKRYELLEGKDKDKKEVKKGNDAFLILLKRAMSDMNAKI